MAGGNQSAFRTIRIVSPGCRGPRHPIQSAGPFTVYPQSGRPRRPIHLSQEEIRPARSLTGIHSMCEPRNVPNRPAAHEAPSHYGNEPLLDRGASEDL